MNNAMDNFLCFAHRGASGHEPENTLPAFEKAVVLGADWIELDVHAVEDELLVIHDDTLERTTNGKGRLTEKRLAYLRSLDAGNGYPIPTLLEVIDLIDKRTGINIELKGQSTAYLAVSLIDSAVRNQGWDYEQFIVSSFRHKTLAEIKKYHPNIRIGALTGKWAPHSCEFAVRLNAFSIHPMFKHFSRSLIQEAHATDIRVYSYTANNTEDIALALDMGFDGVFTDYPELVALTKRKTDLRGFCIH
jgi:glycerophosphoryl diester phosphodiesterase